MSESMIERMARAWVLSLPVHADDSVIGKAEWALYGEEYMQSARAVVAALESAGYVIVPREPTEAMIASDSYRNGQWSRRNWQAMISAAKETP